MKHSWVAVVTFIFGFLSLGSAQCSDECCYQYDRIPGNLTCNPQEGNVAVLCRVYAPNDSIASLSVKWYRSDNIGVYAEQVASIQFDPRTPRAVINGGLVRLSANLMLQNFSAENSGYYWCQMVVNNTCFQPSPSGLIQVVEENCTTSSRNAGIKLNNSHIICAAELSLSDCPLMGATSSTTSTTAGNINIDTSVTTFISSSMPTAIDSNSSMSNGSFCNPDFESPYCYLMVAGFLVVAFTLILLFVFLPVCLCVRKRKRKERNVDSSKPTFSDSKLQNTNAEISKDSCPTDDRGENHLNSATNSVGFVSVSLYVPSDYLPPPGDTLHIAEDHTEQENSEADAHMYDAIELGQAEESTPVIMEGMRDVGVALNFDNHTKEKEVTGRQQTENNGTATNIVTYNSHLEREALVPCGMLNDKSSSLPGRNVAEKVGDQLPADEHGYDMIDYGEKEDLQHEYDMVLFEQKHSNSTLVEHNYHVLENDKEQYATAKTHTLTMSNVESEEERTCISNKHGIMVESGSISDAVMNSTEPIKSSVHSTVSKHLPNEDSEKSRKVNTEYDEPMELLRPLHRETTTEYDEPMELLRPLHRKTTYSSTALMSGSARAPSKETSMNHLFDDPDYGTATTCGFNKDVGEPSSITEASSLPQPSTTEQNKFTYESIDSDLIQVGPGDFQPGDLSELEPSDNVVELAPAPDGSDETASLKPAHNATPSGILFDDPMYDFGMNKEK